MDYKGVIIGESLENTRVLQHVKVLETKVEKVTERHKTPWLKKWTLHIVEIPENKARLVAQKISKSLDSVHNDWYADFKNDRYHFIVFRNRAFVINRKRKEDYVKAVKYGLSLGIPDYQLDFSPDVLP